MTQETVKSIRIVPICSPIISQGILATDISPVHSVTVEGIPDFSAHDITFNIYGLSKAGFFIERTTVCPGEIFLSEKKNELTVYLASSPLRIKKDFFKNLSAPVSGKICVEATIDGKKYMGDSPCAVYPRDIYPSSASPVIFPSFLTPFDDDIKRISSSVKELQELYCALRSENIIYSVKDCDFLSHDIKFEDPATVFSHRSKMASPFEMAVIFCSAALACGKKPILAVSKTRKAPRIFCGCLKKGSFSHPLICSQFAISEYILAGKICLFDISCLFTGHSVEFDDACKNAADEISSLDVSFALDISLALKKEVGFICENEQSLAFLSELRKAQPKKRRNLSDYAEALCDTVKNPLLSFAPEKELCLPVFLSDIKALPALSSGNKDIKLSPLSEKLDESVINRFVDISMLGTQRDSELTISEKRENADGKKALLSYLASEEKKGLVSIYGDGRTVHSVLSSFADEQDIYLACGFLKTSRGYAPAALYPIRIFFNDNTFSLSFLSPKPYANRLLAETLGNSPEAKGFFERYGTPSGNLSDIIGCFEALCLEKKNSFSFIKECFIAKFPYKNSILSFEIVDKYEKINADKLTSSILSGEKLTEDASSHGEYSHRIRESESFSAGIYPSGVYEAAAEMSDRDVLFFCEDQSVLFDAAVGLSCDNIRGGRKTLAVTPNASSAARLYSGFKCLGIDDAVLVLSGERPVAQALSEKLIALSKAELSETDDTFDTEYFSLRDKLSLYSSCKTKRYDFDFSFRDAADAFADTGRNLTESERKILLEPDNIFLPDMGKDSVEKIFESQMKLTRAASALGFKAPFSQHPLFGTKITDKNINVTTCSLVAEKCIGELAEFLPSCRSIAEKTGFSAEDIKTLPSLYAFLSLIVLISKEYKSGITETLLTSDIYSVSKKIPLLRELAEKIAETARELSEFSDEIYSLSPTELSEGYADAKSRSDITKKLNELRTGISAEIPKRNIPEVIRALSDNLRYKAEFSENSEGMDEYFGIFWKKTETDWNKLTNLVSFAKMADVLLKKMYGTDSALRHLAAANFEKAALFCKDRLNITSVLSTAGLFDRMFSDDGSFIGLSKQLCADLYNMTFHDGILSENGIEKKLCDWQSAMDMLPAYAEYNRCAAECESLGLSCFTRFIEENGYSPSVNRIFTRSVLHLAMRQINLSDRNFVTYADYEEDAENFAVLHKNRIEKNRERLKNLYYKNCVSFINSNSEKASAFSESLSDSSFSSEEILLRYGETVKSLFPVIIAEPFYARLLSGFDHIIIPDGDTQCVEEMIPLLHQGTHRLVLSGARPEKAESLAAECEALGMRKINSRSLGNFTDGRSMTYCSDGSSYAVSSGCADVSYLMTPVSSYDREHGTNVLEAQTIGLEIIKICEKDAASKIAVLTLTKEQSRVMENILGTVSEKSHSVKEALLKGRIEISHPMNTLSSPCDILFISTVYGKDEGLSLAFACGDLCDREKTVNGVSQSIARALSFASGKLIVVSSLQKNVYPEKTASYGIMQIFSLVRFAQSEGAYLNPDRNVSGSGYVTALCELACEHGYPVRIICGGAAASVTVGNTDFVLIPECPDSYSVYDSECRLLTLLREKGHKAIRVNGADIILNPQKIADRIKALEESI